MNIPIISSFSFYLIGMLAIGIYFYLRTKNLSDYVLGGRQLGGGVAALSAGASDMSGWLLLGLPGAMYVGGMNNVWIGVGLVIGAYLNWQFVARRLRIFTEAAEDSITLPDYLENRFNDKSRVLRVASAAVILIFFTIYTSAGMVGGAILFEETFGAYAYDATWMAALALKREDGSNPDEIAKALHQVGMAYDGATGDKSFDRDGMQVIEYYQRMVYQEGKLVPYK